jgi:hypothetical protein
MQVSSTPRLLGSIAAVSGILDHPHSRMMTIVMGVRAFVPHKNEMAAGIASSGRSRKK